MRLSTEMIVEGTVIAMYNRLIVPRLFAYADEGHWDLIPLRAKRHPSEARFIHKYAPNDTALHRLVRPFATSEESTLPSSPSMGSSKSQLRRTYKARILCIPPDIDVSDHSSTASKTDPEYADPQSRTPKPEQPQEHNQQQQSLSLQLEQDPIAAAWLLHAVEALLIANPAAATTKNRFGRTPLHIACRQSNLAHNFARMQVILMLLEHSPHVASWTDQDGKTPLYHLVEQHWLRQTLQRQQHDDDGSLETAPFPSEVVEAFLRADNQAIQRVKMACNRKDPYWAKSIQKMLAVASSS